MPNQSQTKANLNSKSSVSSANAKGKELGKGGTKKGGKGADEDLAWAEEDPDEDMKGWKMRVSKGAAELAEELGV